MGLLKETTDIAAGTTNNNLVNGSKFEFLGRPAAVRLYATAEAVASGTLIDFTLGNTVVGDNMIPNQATTAGKVDRNQDLLAAGLGMPGDRIQIRARNPHASIAQELYWLLEIVEM